MRTLKKAAIAVATIAVVGGTPAVALAMTAAPATQAGGVEQLGGHATPKIYYYGGGVEQLGVRAVRDGGVEQL